MNGNINQIVLTADFLRDPDLDIKDSKLQNNVRVFSTLFADLLGEIAEIPIITKFECLGGGLRDLIYRRSGYEPPYNKRNWNDIFHNEAHDPAIMEGVEKYFGSSLVIGIELPEVLKNYFESLSIPYVDVICHPIRYMDDLALGIATNSPAIYRRLLPYQANTDCFRLQATYLKTAYISRNPTSRILPDSCVIFGQTDEDISIMREDGSFANLLDYKPELEDFTRKYRHVYFKPHPYGGKSPELIGWLSQSSNFSLLTNANAYDLYADENVALCTGLSSGSLYEAKFFGKPVKYLFRQPFEYGEDYVGRPIESYDFRKVFITVCKEYLTYAFWSDILAEVIPTKKKEHIDINTSNAFRYGCQGVWSFNDNKSVWVEREIGVLKKELSKPIWKRFFIG